MSVHRAVGYCTTRVCPEYARGIFLLFAGETFRCTQCRKPGRLRQEQGHARNTEPIFKEVRLEFDYDFGRDCYASTAIVRDESLWGRHNTYYYHSPLTRARHHALKIAERVLGTLNLLSSVPPPGTLPIAQEVRLCWDTDLETFSKECSNWAETLRNSHLTLRN